MTFEYDMVIKAIVNNSTPIVIENASNTFVHEAMSGKICYVFHENKFGASRVNLYRSKLSLFIAHIVFARFIANINRFFVPFQGIVDLKKFTLLSVTNTNLRMNAFLSQDHKRTNL